MEFHQLQILEVREETDDCVSVAFHIPSDLEKKFRFVPGQYLTLKHTIAGEEIRRSYSICSTPDEQLRVAIKVVPDGIFSTWANDKLNAGMTIAVAVPQGNFIHNIDPEAANHYVAFVAGSGITPIMSIVTDVLEKEPKSSFSLFYGNRTTQQIIFREELEALKNQHMERFQLYHILSRETTESPLLSGRIDPERCDVYFKYFIPTDKLASVFLCGPYEMIMGMKEQLPKCGVDAADIKFELFYNPEVDDVNETPTIVYDHDHQIKITLDGLTSEIASRLDVPILDMAIDAGMDLPYSCKGGVCATCKAKITAGDVEMTTNFALEPEEVEQGYVLTCQAHALTDFVEVNFDI